MVAAAYKVILKIVADSGRTFQYQCTASDVNGAYFIFPDGGSDVVLSSVDGTLHIVDILLSSGGTDTSKSEVFVGGRSTGEIVMNAANITTAVQRQFTGFPINIAAGSRLKFVQQT